jgi:hypothetical protein
MTFLVIAKAVLYLGPHSHLTFSEVRLASSARIWEQPHVPVVVVVVVVYYSDEAMQLLAVLRFAYLHDGYDLVLHRLDTFSSYPVV